MNPHPPRCQSCSLTAEPPWERYMIFFIGDLSASMENFPKSARVHLGFFCLNYVRSRGGQSCVLKIHVKSPTHVLLLLCLMLCDTWHSHKGAPRIRMGVWGCCRAFFLLNGQYTWFNPELPTTSCWLAGFFFFFLVFLGRHPWHMEGPRLGVKLEL